MEPKTTEAWNLLLGIPRHTKGNFHRPREENLAGQGGAGWANTGQERKLHSYSPSRCAEFYFSFYLFLLLKPCFSP